MNQLLTQSQNLYLNDIPTPLGQITSLGTIYRGTGTGRGVMRVYGTYAVAYFLEGMGQYSDANGFHHKIVPGDLVLVTPELPHRYTTRPGHYWNECYLIFDGPVFDLCQTQGILNPARPVIHLEPIDLWLARLQSVITSPTSQSPVEKMAEVGRLLALLMEMLAQEDDALTGGRIAPWLLAAKARFAENMEIEIDPISVAQELGVHYETFHKGFQKQFSVSPGLYRTQRRIAVACRLLKLTTMTQQRIAAHLGFSDEFYFFKRFKQIVGVSPRKYRGMAYEQSKASATELILPDSHEG